MLTLIDKPNTFHCASCGIIGPEWPEPMECRFSLYAILRTDSDAWSPKVCEACANTSDMLAIAKTVPGSTVPAALYLSSDGKTVTTFKGAVMMYVHSETVSRGGLGFEQTYCRLSGLDGTGFVGRGPGRGMYIRVRRNRGKLPQNGKAVS